MPLIFSLRRSWYLGALLTLEGLFLPGLTSKWPACQCTFHIQPNKARATIHLPDRPRPSTRQLGTARMPQSLLRVFKLADPQPAYRDSPVPARGNHSKDPCLCFPLTPSTSWLMLVLPIWCPGGVASPLCSGSVRITEYIFAMTSVSWSTSLNLPYLIFKYLFKIYHT